MHYHITPTDIKTLIYHVRGKAVMLDSDLAILYQVPTGRLNEAVKRNAKRFPKDFMFQISKTEFANLKSQNATSSSHGGRRKLPNAFTEQGVAMLSGILNSDVAIEVNIGIMRAFVQMRRLGANYAGLDRKISSMENKYDRQFKVIFDAIRKLINPSAPPKSHRKMGIHP